MGWLARDHLCSGETAASNGERGRGWEAAVGTLGGTVAASQHTAQQRCPGCLPQHLHTPARTRLCGSVRRCPGAPAASSREAMEAAWPTASVPTGQAMYCGGGARYRGAGDRSVTTALPGWCQALRRMLPESRVSVGGRLYLHGVVDG
jgi:hypothetical protein